MLPKESTDIVCLARVMFFPYDAFAHAGRAFMFQIGFLLHYICFFFIGQPLHLYVGKVATVLPSINIFPILSYTV